MAGDLVYFTIPVPDGERAQRFYGDVLGWEFGPGNVPGGSQVTNVSPRGGIFSGGEGSHPVVYFHVDDVAAAIARVRANGGEAEDPQEIASGYMSHCRDDQGTHFGLWQARRRA